MLIGEVAARSGVSARMLRHYESLGLLEPRVNSSGFREFSAADVQRILHIEGLRSLGLSLAEVADALHDPHFRPGSVIADLIADSQARLRAEKELLHRLRAVKAAEVDNWQSALDVVELMGALRSSNPAHRQSIAFAQGVKKNSSLIATLVDSALKEDNPNVEGALTWAILQAEDSVVEVVSMAARGLRAADSAIRFRAVRIIAAAQPSGLRTSLLLGCLDDPSAEIRAHSALALSKEIGIGGAEVEAELVSMVLEGVQDVEAAEALAARAAAGVPGVVLDHFAKELRTREVTDPARARITQALAEFPAGMEQVEQLLEELSRDKNPQVAFTAQAVRLGRQAK